MMITAERLREVVHYNPIDGIFTWRVAKPRYAIGSVAGRIRSDGYYAIKIDQRDYLAHRLAWLYTNGYSAIEIDHKNGNRDDCRIENLRECTRSQNFANRGPKPGRSLPKGVRPCRSRFQARIVFNRKEIHLGIFDTVEEARAAYLTAAQSFYGEFARSEAVQDSSHRNGEPVYASRER